MSGILCRRLCIAHLPFLSCLYLGTDEVDMVAMPVSDSQSASMSLSSVFVVNG